VDILIILVYIRASLARVSRILPGLLLAELLPPSDDLNLLRDFLPDPLDGSGFESTPISSIVSP